MLNIILLLGVLLPQAEAKDAPAIIWNYRFVCDYQMDVGNVGYAFAEPQAEIDANQMISFTMETMFLRCSSTGPGKYQVDRGPFDPALGFTYNHYVGRSNLPTPVQVTLVNGTKVYIGRGFPSGYENGGRDIASVNIKTDVWANGLKRRYIQANFAWDQAGHASIGEIKYDLRFSQWLRKADPVTMQQALQNKLPVRKISVYWNPGIKRVFPGGETYYRMHEWGYFIVYLVKDAQNNVQAFTKR